MPPPGPQDLPLLEIHQEDVSLASFVIIVGVAGGARTGREAVEACSSETTQDKTSQGKTAQETGS